MFQSFLDSLRQSAQSVATRITTPSPTPPGLAGQPSAFPGQGPLSGLSASRADRPDGRHASPLRVRLPAPASGRDLAKLKAPMRESPQRPATAAAAGTAEPLPDLADLYRLARPEIPDTVAPARNEPPPMQHRPLPVPGRQPVQTGLAQEAALGMHSAASLFQQGRRAFGSAQGGQGLAALLAGWPPMTDFLAACTPELAKLHRSIDQYGADLRDRIKAHRDGASSSGAAPHPPLHSVRYRAHIRQAAQEVAALRHAANLAAVQGRYFSRAEGVEGDLQLAASMRSSKAAAPFVERLRTALAERTLDPGWIHPTQGWNHLHVAAAAGDAGLARALVNAGVRPHLADEAGMTPLHVAAANGHAEPAAVFMITGADVDAPSATGFSPLQFAALSGSRACVEALLRGGADIDLQDPLYGITALHVAAAESRLDAVQGLVAAGANPLLRANDGSTVLDALEASDKARSAPGYQSARVLLRKAADMARILSGAR